jgi:hypothetical protein
VTDVAFLDANVLAKPFTRTLIVVGAAAGADYGFAWSRYAENEGNRHLREAAKRLDVFRAERGIALSPTGAGAEVYTETDPKDRQILADAVAARARWIVTENVYDFRWRDVRRAGVSAVRFDLFLAEHLPVDAYRQALEILSHGRVEIDLIRANAALLHPRLFGAMEDAFPGVRPSTAAHNPPREVLRSPHRLP